MCHKNELNSSDIITTTTSKLGSSSDLYSGASNVSLELNHCEFRPGHGCEYRTNYDVKFGLYLLHVKQGAYKSKRMIVFAVCVRNNPY